MSKLTIMMSSFNRGEIVGHAIQSILDNELPKGLELELIVIDDRSNKQTWDIVKKFKNDPRCKIIRNKTRAGTGAANWNRAFKMATGDLITYTADDMVFDSNYIKNLYKELMKQDKYTAVVGIFINAKNLDNLPKPTLRSKDNKTYLHPLTGIPSNATDGGNQHISRNAYFCHKEFLEGLDEFLHVFPVNGIREETDQHLRIMRLKPQRKVVVVNNAVRWHIHNKVGGFRMDNKLYRKWTRINHNTFLKRNFGARAYYMIFFSYCYYVQKWIRDLIGTNIIERYLKRSKTDNC